MPKNERWCADQQSAKIFRQIVNFRQIEVTYTVQCRRYVVPGGRVSPNTCLCPLK